MVSLPIPWRSAQHQPVVDLVLRLLGPMREPAKNVVGVVGVDITDVIQPHAGFVGIAGQIFGRPIEIEYRGAL